MNDNDSIITAVPPRAAAFNTVANLLATIEDADLRQLLADSIIEYGAACAQQVLDSWTQHNKNRESKINDLQAGRVSIIDQIDQDS